MKGKRAHTTSAFLTEALDRGAEQFKWNERVARQPRRIGSKVRGVGVSLSCYVGGTIGFDGLLVDNSPGTGPLLHRNRQPGNGIGDGCPSRRC